MKLNQIYKEYTDMVAQYMAKGMAIVPDGGHQGEEMKIDLTDWQDVYRIILIRCTSGHIDGLELAVIKYNGIDSIAKNVIRWSNTGEVISSRKFWETRGWYSECDPVELQHKIFSRIVDDEDIIYWPSEHPKMMKPVLRWLHKQKGHKSDRLKDVHYVAKRKGGYSVYAKNDFLWMGGEK